MAAVAIDRSPRIGRRTPPPASTPNGRPALALRGCIAIALTTALVACGPDGEDQSRRNELANERVVLVEPPGAERSGSVEQHPPQRDELTLEFGPNLVDRTFEVEFSDDVSVLGFYLDELEADEWVDIDVICQPDSTDRTAWASAVAKKRLDDFTGTVKVSVSYTEQPANVRVTMSAPFHDDDGAAPDGASPDVHASCEPLL
jgi:hypothetical protein